MNNYNSLDLNYIKNRITELAYIEEAKEYITKENVDFNPLLIKKKVLETTDALKLINDDFDISFDGIKSCDNLLTKARKNVCLDPNEFKELLVFNNHCLRIKNILNKYQDLSLLDYSDSIYIDNTVFDEIAKFIDCSGQIKMDSSDNLIRINNSLQENEKQLAKKAEIFINRNSDSLQELNVYTRNERICFLVKNADKNKFSGYNYGSSSSNLASYVEPASFIEINNLKIQLMHDLEDEIERILFYLTYLVNPLKESYSNNFDSLVKLDVIFAKARYGFKNNGIMATIVDNNYFDFKDLCHPLIDPIKVVSNDYRLFSPYKGIVISGSNTGGKTISLKAIGLSIIMTYLAIPIIASKASVPIYHNVYVDIDDNQSVIDSLSTFSAHISNINYILKNADKDSLILIDELISGTDPKQAQAISLAILDKIKEIGASFIITTHFDDIKKYSFDDENILLSSVSFDLDLLKPTYHYLENSIGSSNAIDIALRYIDDTSIIDNARYYLKKNQSEQDILLDKLANESAKLSSQMEIVKNREIEIADLKKQYEDLISKFNKEKIKLKSQYEQKLNNEIEEIKQLAINQLNVINKNCKEKEIIQNFDKLKTEETESIEKIDFKIGDNVRIKDNEQIGQIIDIKGSKATIVVKGISIKTDIDSLTLMPKTNSLKKAKVKTNKYQRVPSSINLVGEHIEDGISLLNDYLDKANAAKMKQVKIIHGIGSGDLRKALRKEIGRLSYVKSYKDGDYYDGGSAVTIVEFK